MNDNVKTLLGIALFLVIGALIFSFAWNRPEKVYIYDMPRSDYYYDVPVMRRPLFDGVVPVRRLDYNPWRGTQASPWPPGFIGSAEWYGGGKGNVGWHSGHH